jgi:hypothetical protein
MTSGASGAPQQYPIPGHNDDYWRRVAPAEIDWIGAQLVTTSPAPSPAV